MYIHMSLRELRDLLLSLVVNLVEHRLRAKRLRDAADAKRLRVVTPGGGIAQVAPYLVLGLLKSRTLKKQEKAPEIKLRQPKAKPERLLKAPKPACARPRNPQSVKIICAECEQMQALPCEIRGSKRFCSQKCRKRAERQRYRKRPNGRVGRAVRRRFQKVMRDLLDGRPKDWSNVVGCTPTQLKRHLERQFTKGMSWANYGGKGCDLDRWHIDHIKPCASFDLRDPEQVKACFHYTNLQPLWSLENLAKSCHLNAS